MSSFATRGLFSRKHKPWEFDVRELPPLRLIAGDERLAGLENNAAYRIMAWKLGMRSPLWASLITHFIILPVALWVIIPSGAIWMVIVGYIIASRFIAQSDNANMTMEHIREVTTKGHFFSVPQPHLGDLTAGTFGPADWAAAAWGRRLGERRIAGMRVHLTLMAIASAGFYAYALARPFRGAWVAPLLAGLVCFAMANGRREGLSGPLPGIQSSLKGFRRGLEYRDLPWHKKISHAIRRFPVVLVAVGGVIILVVIGAAVIESIGGFDFDSLPDVGRLIVSPLGFTGCCLACWLAGEVRGRRIRARKDIYFGLITAHIKFILDWIERRSEGGRWSGKLPEEAG